jgi:hypothetical protein
MPVLLTQMPMLLINRGNYTNTGHRARRYRYQAGQRLEMAREPDSWQGLGCCIRRR